MKPLHLRFLLPGLLLLVAAFASEDEAGKRLDAFSAVVAKNFPGYYFGDKDFRQTFYATSEDILTFEVTLFTKVNYVLVCATDNDIDNLDVEGKFGFDPPAGTPEKDTLFPFYISFLKKNQYAFSVPVTGTYKFLFRLQPRRDNSQTTAYIGWTLAYELPKK
ncbi:MAG: hypothetical protein J0L75_11860 [Spirochaetes bacterium]|nr:hypothetical protein [Spirochaetota bacterium]